MLQISRIPANLLCNADVVRRFLPADTPSPGEKEQQGFLEITG